MVKTYKSAVDLWLAAMLAGAPLAGIFSGAGIALGLQLLSWHAHEGRIIGLFFLGCGVALAALILLFTLPCRYTLRERELDIRCGVLKATVPYRDIRGLELSCSPLVAPALSLNRVKIILDDGIRLISPRDRTAFVVDLQQRLDRHRLS